MKNITWALFASRKALNAITIKYKNGFVQAFHRDHRTNFTCYIYSESVNSSVSSDQGWSEKHRNISAIWYREPLDMVTGETTGDPKPIPPDDLINIAGISEVADGAASWHVKVSKFTDSPLLSAALPVLDSPNGSIVAVVGVTTALYSVGQLMKELVEFHSGYMYLTSAEGYVIATSTNAPLLTNLSSGPKLMMAVDSEDRIIKLGAKWLERASGNQTRPNHEVHAEDVRLGHQKYYIDSFFLNLKRLPLVGVIIIPRKYVMGKVDQRALTTLVILISASVCILIIGCVCILILTSGVSKEMKLRAELISHLDARRRAEASNNYKSQFLANMSHELRTPMAAVIGLLDILICDDCLTNEQYATVTQIRKCSTALLRLLNNILDLSKVESGKLVLEEAEFDLGRELEGLVDMFSVQCINHNVETVLDLADGMPKLVLGDSARVVQIFANLISNSMKFTSTGHIILRGWRENFNNATYSEKLPLDHKDSRSLLRTKSRQQRNHANGTSNNDNRIILWFEVEDTGCGIDPNKWEAVFESFEQADPSTTRTHGGTGLGLCIVRTLSAYYELAFKVNQMGGEIKVVKKDGPGTVMQLSLVLSTPGNEIGWSDEKEYCKHSLKVLLAVNGTIGRSIMSQWLRKKGVCAWDVSEWNELTTILQEFFPGSKRVSKSGFKTECSMSEISRGDALESKNVGSSKFLIVIDIGLLDLSTSIWKEQLKFLDTYHGLAKFAWILNHDTCNSVKMDLRRKGYLLMVNKPLYKTKMIHILDAVIKERNVVLQRKGCNASKSSTVEGDLHESFEFDPFPCDAASSDDSDASAGGKLNFRSSAALVGEKVVESLTMPCTSHCNGFKNGLVELSRVGLPGKNVMPGYPFLGKAAFDIEDSLDDSYNGGNISALAEPICGSSKHSQHQVTNNDRMEQHYDSGKVASRQKSLEGLCILLAEDTPVLQRVATIMLEKMGAAVVVVGDGLQAVDALKSMVNAERKKCALPLQDDESISQTQLREFPVFHLILMDCQMPRMDGYEATKAIRKFEGGTDFHIPIVALTAHAMSSDEAKCLEVGMDAYLTKPIDCKLMMSTIISLTRENV
ncbi:Histidine kinase [Thalictrum thalictroides]|uniref:histidine kinase n=1 Tax=Thalictrum thalictroides TaxID=46969 RepID=A0A7J6W368_THATH|nr:Histidine kinase [Thalictrum thalictroides]